MKKIAIMQPYFLPYIGYWQLINAVDIFVIYDNIQYTKKGWINRNRFLQNNQPQTFSIPLKKDHSFKNVDERIISEEYNKKNLLAKFMNAYIKAPYYKENFEIISNIINYDNNNLFEYIYYSVTEIKKYLNIKTQIIKSSEININHNLKSQDKVIEICKTLNADIYINAIGGQELYDKKVFERENIQLNFIKTCPISYTQFNNSFVENLSILDILMFNSKCDTIEMLEKYELI